MRDDWIIYAAIGVFVCLLLWRTVTSAIGTKRTFPRAPSMSVFGGKADIGATFGESWC